MTKTDRESLLQVCRLRARVEPFNDSFRTFFNDSFEQYVRRAYFPITEKTAPRVMSSLRTLGFPGDSFDRVGPRVDLFHSFVGKHVEFSCVHEADLRGQQREVWFGLS
jgi:hypothetical protein